MYIPSHFKFQDKQQITAFMKRYSFATFITANGNVPIATHIPFCVEQEKDEIILSSHFAKGNPQVSELELCRSLVIFNEPHAYIAPKNYEKEESVPTWNYIAVHAYGKAVVIADTDRQLALMEKMISVYDQDYLQQWAGLSMDFKLRMLKGIVAFEIKVDDLQAQQKLSQNKKESEREKIIAGLKNSPHATEQELAAYMNTDPLKPPM